MPGLMAVVPCPFHPPTICRECRKSHDQINAGVVDMQRARNFSTGPWLPRPNNHSTGEQRAARKARNPRTGAKVFVPEKFVVTFKPGKEMEEKVRLLEQQAAEARARAAGQTPSAEAPMVQTPAAQAGYGVSGSS